MGATAPQPRPVEPRPCHACPAMVYDLRHVGTGRIAPIEVEETPNARCRIDLESGTYWLPGIDLRIPPDLHRHRNHFETCPAANSFRANRPVR